jgi:hypothetical protein
MMGRRDTLLDALLAICKETGQMARWPEMLIWTLRFYETTAPKLTFADEVWLRGQLAGFEEDAA